MRILSRTEVFNSIQQTRSLTEEQAATFLTRFCQEQPAIKEMLFVGFPMAIKTQNEYMSLVFMDICFEIIFSYEIVLGKLRANIVSSEWLHQKMTEIDKEVKAQTQANNQGQIDLQNKAQIQLLEYIGLAIKEAAGNDKKQQEVVGITYNMLFLVTRLFDKIYAELTSEVFH